MEGGRASSVVFICAFGHEPKENENRLIIFKEANNIGGMGIK